MEDIQKEDAYACPSFNSYSSDRLAEIAVRVAGGGPTDAGRIGLDNDDFEFTLFRDGREISNSELGVDGLFNTGFPVFDRDLLLANAADGDGHKDGPKIEEKPTGSGIAVTLSELFAEESENPPSCSSSEAGELENIPAGTYCVWRPRKEADQPSPGWCKKSSSTGSASKRWRFSDMLRSNSEGKDSFVFLTPKNREVRLSPVEAPGKAKGRGARSAHEALYVQNRAVAEGNKKRSYLPYRRDLVGFFVSVNGFPRF